MLTNAKQTPKVFYGLHFSEGVAEYQDTDQSSAYRILISNEVINRMHPTFSGKPVYVEHVEKVNLDKIQEEADGYVVESFFNKLDGRHWCKFIVVSDKGHEAIRAGWKLSNAYIPKEFAGAGKWHNVDYSKEVMNGEYEHLAIVPNPRYEESIILDAEQFKAYNSQKEEELKKLSNSKGDSSMFKFFKKTKVENSTDLETTSVVLKSGTEKTIAQLINEVEAMEEKKENEEKEKADGKMPMANGEHMVKCDDGEMSVNELVSKYNEMMGKKKEEPKKENEEKKAEEEKKEAPAAEKKENEEADKKEEEKKEDKKENSIHFDALKNAHLVAESQSVETSMDKVARGKARYGSK